MDEPIATANRPKNIVILSDGTGQVGGIYFDEVRTNIYKLFRATRAGPDTCIDPDRQVAFYDSGLGTLQPDGSLPLRLVRKIYNFISQATGLGITQNIVDCYAAIIRNWRPGDRIFLFGFSRGAYTVRCLATVLWHCGVPQTDKSGNRLKLDFGTTQKVASDAVKNVYQHVSSPRDMKYMKQRRQLGALFRKDHQSVGNADNTEPNAFPFFIGAFDTVASLSSSGALALLVLLYLLIHLAIASVLAFSVSPFQFWYWFNWITVWSICLAIGAYVYTHLKFSTRLRDHAFWNVIHLTKFRQKFYDGFLHSKVGYARHAVSIDERRHSFPRVWWGSKNTPYDQGARVMNMFEQKWFAGNHADIGGGYPENESRLSDIALAWMIEEAANPKLGDQALIVDSSFLCLNGRASGMQHDETRSSFFRWAKKTLRLTIADADLHSSVIERFKLDEIQDYNVMRQYRPESLRKHPSVAQYYTVQRPPARSCYQRIEDVVAPTIRSAKRSLKSQMEKVMPKANYFGRIDSFLSCVGFVGLIVLNLFALWILFFWQIVPWLRDGVWRSYPLSWFYEVRTGWVGLQLILDWLFYLPAVLISVVIGLAIFWFFGILAARSYELSGDPPTT